MATTGAPAYIPLLDDSSPITPIQAPFNAIATALNNYLQTTDSGWKTVTSFNGGFSAATTVRYKKIGSIVYLSGSLYCTSAPSNGTAFTLPDGFRPLASVALGGIAAWAMTVEVIVGSGNVVITANTARTSGAGFKLDGISFPVA